MLRTVYITQFVTAPIQAKFALLVRFEIRLIFFTQWICPITCKPLSLEAESGFCTTYRAAHEQVVIHKKKSTKCTMADQSVPLHLTSKKTNDVQICTWRHCYEKTTTSTICICKTKQTNKVRSSNWRRFGCTTMCGKPRDTGPGSLLAPFVSLSCPPLLCHLPSSHLNDLLSNIVKHHRDVLCAQLYNLLLQCVHIDLVTCTGEGNI